MTKTGSRYYLQYAAPGTEFNVYANGTYVGEKPLRQRIAVERVNLYPPQSRDVEGLEGLSCLDDRVELDARHGVEAGVDQAEFVADFQNVWRNVAA